MHRYTATITLRVEYDAANRADAANVAEQIEGAVTFPAPRGRGAELVSVQTYSTRTGGVRHERG